MSEEKKKLSKKSIILISVLAVLALVIGGAIWFVSDLIGDYITGEDDPIFSIDPSMSVNPSDFSTATPRPDSGVTFVDGSFMEGFMYTYEEYSKDESLAEPTVEFQQIKDMIDGDFIVIHSGMLFDDDNIEESYNFGKDVNVTLVVTDYEFENGKLYRYENGMLLPFEYTDRSPVFEFVTDRLGVFVYSANEVNIPAVTPTPELTPTPSLEPTPVVTPTPTIEPTPVVTPTPTPELTPTPVPTAKPTTPPVATINPNDKDVIVIALFGLDTRKNNFTGRSDTIMILAINTKTNKMTLTSVMRDLEVEYAGCGKYTGRKGKINAAFAYGGVSGAMATVEKYFGIEIDNYAVVNFQGIKDIISILGGVTIDLTKQEHGIVFYDDKNNANAAAGTYDLDAAQTLKYMSIRKIDNDRYRTLRQGKVLQALMDKFSSASWDELYQLLVQCSSYVKTDMNLARMATVALKVFEIKDQGLKHNSFPNYAPPVYNWQSVDPSKGNYNVIPNNKALQIEWFRKRVYSAK